MEARRCTTVQSTVTSERQVERPVREERPAARGQDRRRSWRGHVARALARAGEERRRGADDEREHDEHAARRRRRGRRSVRGHESAERDANAGSRARARTHARRARRAERADQRRARRGRARRRQRGGATSSNRRFASCERRRAASASPRSTLRSASFAGTHAARIAVDVGIGSPSARLLGNAREHRRRRRRDRASVGATRTTWCADVARAIAAASRPASHAHQRARVGSRRAFGERTADSTVSERPHRRDPPAARTGGSGSTR